MLSTNQLAQISTADVALLTTSAMMGFSDHQLGALSSAQLSAFTTTQASVLKTLTPLVLDLSGIEALSTANVAGLSSQAFNVLTSKGSDPGIQTQQIGKSGVSFDLGNTGQASYVGWITPGEGFLVDLPTGATSITNGSELFGSATILPNGQTAANGFAALAAFTTPGATEISASDPIFNHLQVWVDTGTDGSRPTGSLFTLSELNIKSLNLSATVANTNSNGNTVGLISSYTTTDGSTHEMADVWLASTSGTLSSTSQLTAALNAYTSSPMGTAATVLSGPGVSAYGVAGRSSSQGIVSNASADGDTSQALSTALAQTLTQSLTQYNPIITSVVVAATPVIVNNLANPTNAQSLTQVGPNKDKPTT